MDTETRILTERREKIKSLKESGIEPFPYSYNKDASAAEIKEVFAGLGHDEKGTARESVKVAGRIMTSRLMGKACFANLQDETGTIQLYIKQDNIGKDKYDTFKLLDLGDIIGASGSVFKTKTGEITIEVKEFELLAKSIRPLPDKWHGLKDPELRYRKRYLDMIANPTVKKTFTLRSKAVKEIRSYLNEQGYLEVETPVLQPQYGGAAARPFITRHNALGMDLYLRISPELYLKRLLIGGFEKVYDINKNFRNEGIDFDHNPEFTMIEWYEAYADYNKMMDMSEELIKRVALKVFGKLQFKFREMDIDMSGTWERLPMIEALQKHAGIDVSSMEQKDLMKLAEQHGYEGKEHSKGHLISFLFEELVEQKLINPTFIIDHPMEISPLTKKHRSKPGLVERAELFIAGSEIANMYSELNDADEQRARLEEQERQRKKDEENNYPMDEDFCEALEYGMPPAGGIGIGIDRIVMILSESASIREVIIFPTMRPENEQ